MKLLERSSTLLRRLKRRSHIFASPVEEAQGLLTGDSGLGEPEMAEQAKRQVSPESELFPAKRQSTLLSGSDEKLGAENADGEAQVVEPKKDVYYRCDVYGKTADDSREAMKECKQLVIEAGGSLMTEIVYPGGFVYTLPSALGYEVLESGDETRMGGFIKVEQCKPLRHPDPLRSNPPTDMYLMEDNVPEISITQMPPASTTSAPPDTSAPRSIETPPEPETSKPPLSPGKEWPRRLDDYTVQRAGNWVREKAAKRRAMLEEEARQGTGMEVVTGEVSTYEGGIDPSSLYMDGYSHYAVWLEANKKNSFHEDESQ